MSDDRQPRNAREISAWMWHVLPLLIVAAALSAAFLPESAASVQANAARPASFEAALPSAWIVPSPQPGSGAPEFRIEDLTQWY